MRSENPEDGVDCYFCNGDGCFCPKSKHNILRDSATGFPKIRTREEWERDFKDCVSCDICEGTGLISRKAVDQMVEHYKAEDQFKKAWKSAM